jgi:carbon monoxide dehydrogenase subunit G
MATAQLNEKKVESTHPTTPAPTPVPQRRRLRSIFAKILVVLAGLIAILCAIIAMQPAEFAVSRSMTMAAPPDAVFAQVNNLHNWEAWSPWAKLDPNAKMTYEGPTDGEGAKVSWDGDANVGAGSMTILESKPNEEVHIKTDFVRPFEGTNDVVFTFKPEGDGTNVTWKMAGKNNFIAKAIGLVMDCEKMCGDYFVEGLTSMKGLVEQKPNT